jgi:hypothetical protein
LRQKWQSGDKNFFDPIQVKVGTPGKNADKK